MDRETIISEIKRTAAENGGKPLGRERFQAETGIRPHHVMKYWARYGDALKEAGLSPNALQEAFDEAAVLRRVAELARELGRFPTWGDFRVKRTNDSTFPSHGVFARFPKPELVPKVAAFCAATPGFDDVAAMCVVEPEQTEPDAKADASNDGFVYLIKSGRHYKIGKTNSVGMRERQLQIQLPEQARTVHSIKTETPPASKRIGTGDLRRSGRTASGLSCRRRTWPPSGDASSCEAVTLRVTAEWGV